MFKVIFKAHDLDAEVKSVLEKAYPGEESRYFPPMSIGSSPEHADEGARLILSGVKTLTSSAFWDYPDGKNPLRRRAQRTAGRSA